MQWAHKSEHNGGELYRCQVNIETALVCVHNDILLTMDSQNVVIMVFLHMPATLDTIHQKVTLPRLSRDVGK